MSKFIVTGTDQVTRALFDAGVIQHDPTYVRRVVIDLQAGNTGMVYVELFADDEKLSVALGAGITVEEAA